MTFEPFKETFQADEHVSVLLLSFWEHCVLAVQVKCGPRFKGYYLEPDEMDDRPSDNETNSAEECCEKCTETQGMCFERLFKSVSLDCEAWTFYNKNCKFTTFQEPKFEFRDGAVGAFMVTGNQMGSFVEAFCVF